MIVKNRKDFEKFKTKLMSDIRSTFDNAAHAVAHQLVVDARDLLRNRIQKYQAKTGKRSKSTGNLARAIEVKQADLGLPGFHRADLNIDLDRAPYAFWVEFGRYAPKGLPYSKVGGPDFSKSRFEGHTFLRGALSKMITKKKWAEAAKVEIAQSLRRKGYYILFK